MFLVGVRGNEKKVILKTNAGNGNLARQMAPTRPPPPPTASTATSITPAILALTPAPGA